MVEDNTKQYGIAIDIGTTTVVCMLVDMENGMKVSETSMINPQTGFGLDVLTRITYEIKHPDDGVKNLQKAIINSINELIAELCQNAAIQREKITDLAVSGNCIMLHMLLGINAEQMGVSPYTPEFTKAQNVAPDSLGINVSKKANLYCLPSVAAYIGADLVAGIYVSDIQNSKENSLLVDIGTNGEIVLSYNDESTPDQKNKLLSCSTAAGPALEGMNIHDGMRAAKGAIEDIKINSTEVDIAVIGDTLPKGICGSGVLSAIREMLRVGIINHEGTFIKPDETDKAVFPYNLISSIDGKPCLIIMESPKKIMITQDDIRQVQLAKAAISAGIATLLDEVNVSIDDIDQVIIAGQFGLNLPAESLIETGILPTKWFNRIQYIGNASLTGAFKALVTVGDRNKSQGVRIEMEKLAQEVEYIQLSTSDEYEQLFLNSINF